MLDAIDKSSTLDNNKLVSVIIPVFNVCSYLVEALDSVLQQTYDNLEIIIIDDGSTDGSREICDEYAEKDARILVIHQENRGLSAARNVGLDKMSGEFVVFLDPDDAYHPDYVKVMMNAMIREQADLVICRYTVNYTTGRMTFKGNKKTRPSIATGVYDRLGALRALADGEIDSSVWNRLYRRGMWKGIRFPDGHVCEDVDTAYRIIDLCNKIYVLDQSLYLYRRRLGSITHTASLKNLSDHLRAHSHFSAFIEANTPEIFNIEQLRKRRQICLQGMFSLYFRCSGKTKAEGELLYEDLRKMIIDKGKETKIGSCDFRIRVAYWMLCVCPNLLRIIYPLYRLRRLFIFRNVYV